MRYLAPFLSGLALVILTACGGGGGNGDVISPSGHQGSISGPQAVDEGTSANYSVERTVSSSATYVWSARPAELGGFENPNQADTNFIASHVDTDTEVDIQVVIQSDNGPPAVSNLKLIIKDRAEAPTNGPENQPPVACASTNTNNVNEGQLVSFNASNSYDPDCAGELSLYEWDWDNDGEFDATGRLLSHTFQEHGIYPVILRVTDLKGDTALLEDPLVVTVNPGIALTWGGPGSDVGNECAVDASGNIYVTGSFAGTVDLDPSYFIKEYTSNGSSGAYLMKYNPDLHLLWITTWGKDDIASGNDIAIRDGYVYIASTDCVTKFTDSGELIWNYDNNKIGEAVAVDPSVGIYVAGHYPAGGDSEPDCFLTALDFDGNLRWEKTWGGDYSDQVFDMVVDSNGNIYVTGHVRGPVDLDPSADEEFIEETSGRDPFISRFDPYGNFGNYCVWSADDAFGMTIDSSDNIFVTGKFVSSIWVHTTQEGNYSESGSEGSYLVSVNNDLEINWARAWTEYDPQPPPYVCPDPGYDVAVTELGEVIVVGSFIAPVDFDPSASEDIVEIGGSYITRYDLDGNYYGVRVWGDHCPINGWDNAYSVAIDPLGNAIITGDFGNVCNFNESGSEYEESSGLNDAYLLKIGSGEY